MSKVTTVYSELPRGYEIAAYDFKLYIKVNGLYIVTRAGGNRRHFKGIDEATHQRAEKWAWRFSEGHYSDDYRVAYEKNEVPWL